MLKYSDKYSVFTEDSGKLLFDCFIGEEYFFKKEYSIIVVNSGPITVSTDKAVASEGEKVNIFLTLADGAGMLSLKVVDSDGKEVGFTGSSEITVRDKDVVITATAAYYIYNVVFVADGKTVLRLEVTHGEMPTIPKDPSIASDGVYSYTFVGWSPEVSVATGDVRYVAVFDKTLIPVSDGNAPVELPDSFQKIIKIAIIGGCVFILVLIGLVVLIVVLVKRKKKRRKAANGGEKSDKNDAEIGTDGADTEKKPSEEKKNPESAEKNKAKMNKNSETDTK